MNKTYTTIGIIAMIATPAAAAIFFGWGAYTYLLAEGVPMLLAIAGGVGVAFALEAVGMLAGHVGIELIRARRWGQMLVPALAMVVYVIVGYTGIEKYAEVFLLAPFVYLLVAQLGMVHNESEATTQAEQDDLAWQRRQQEEEARRQHELALKKAETRRELALAKAVPSTHANGASTSESAASTEQTQASYECEDCGRKFSTVQALNAHGRFCKAKVE